MKKRIVRKLFLLVPLLFGLLLVLARFQTGVARAESDVQEISALQPRSSSSVAQSKPLVIYFFWGDGCPHCAQAEPFLASLAKENPRIQIQAFEVWHNADNAKLMEQVAAGFGFEAQFVPTIFIGEKSWQGFSDAIKVEIEKTVERYLFWGWTDQAAGYLNGVVGTNLPELENFEGAGVTGSEDTLPEAENGGTPPPVDEEVSGTDLSFMGNVDLSSKSLLVSTLLIAFVDGFNPCSIWVLGMLLAITLHSGSRKKVIIIGLVFLTVTALIYALFIAGLFTIFKVVRFMGWIQVVVALVALFFALVNIKDYFWYKEGVSLTIADDKKPGIFQKMRKVMDAGDSFWGLVGGTIVLAVGVSLVEFSCTAGFPVIWTNLLSAQNVSTWAFILLLLVYMLIYQLDELGIFFASVFTLKATKVEEKHGRILKLIGGVLMLTLAVVMLVKPSIMSFFDQSMIVFGIAFVFTLLVLLLHRVVLPRMGIFIGSEFDKKKVKKH